MSSNELAIINLRRELEKTNFVLFEILEQLKKLNEGGESDGT